MVGQGNLERIEKSGKRQGIGQLMAMAVFRKISILFKRNGERKIVKAHLKPSWGLLT